MLFRSPTTYKIQEGDYLSKIAPQFGITWEALYEANKAIIGADPNKIYPGQVLTIPTIAPKEEPKVEEVIKEEPKAGVTVTVPPTGYTGPSIVDYLTSIGQAGDYSSRAKLATEKGILKYTGTAEQNTALLNLLRSGTPIPSSLTTPTVPTVPKAGEEKKEVEEKEGVAPGVPTVPTDWASQLQDWLTRTEQAKSLEEVAKLMKDYSSWLRSEYMPNNPPTSTETSLAGLLGKQQEIINRIKGGLPKTAAEVVPKKEVEEEVEEKEEVTTIAPATTLEQSLIDKYGYTLEQVHDKGFLNTEISNLMTSVKDLQKGVEKENAIIKLVELGASLGLPYDNLMKYISAMAPPAESEADRRKRIYEKYGITGLEEKAFATPEETYEDIYKRAYTQSGLADVKKNMEVIAKEMNKTTEDYNVATGGINANPYLSEAGRVGQIRETYNMYEAKFTRLQAKYTLAQHEYERGQDRAENVAVRTLNELERDRIRTKEELKYYVARGNADLEAEIKATEEVAEKELMRYYPEWIKAHAPKEEKPQLKQLKNGEWAWIYPSGKVVKTGEIGKTAEEKTFLSSADYKELSLKGIPKNVADAISLALQAGDDLETMRTDLAKFFGKDKGYKYLDEFIVWLKGAVKRGTYLGQLGEKWGIASFKEGE